MTRRPDRALILLPLLLLFLGAAAATATATAPPRVLLYLPVHVSTDASALVDFSRCTLSKPAGSAAGFDILVVISGAGAREAARNSEKLFTETLISALDVASATTAATAAARGASIAPPKIKIDYLELPLDKDSYSSVENSFAGPNSAFFDAFLKEPHEENDDENNGGGGGGGGGDDEKTKKTSTTTRTTVFERHIRGKYPLVLQMEVDVCATGAEWLEAALEPLVAVVRGGTEKKNPSLSSSPSSDEISAAVSLVVEELRREGEGEEEEEEAKPLSPSSTSELSLLFSRLPAVVGATLGGACIHVSAPAASPHCSPLSEQPRHMRQHLNGNALYLATSSRFQRLARVARALAGDRDELLPFDLALWAAEQLLLEEEEEEEEEVEGKEDDDEPSPSRRYLLRNPRMLNLGRHVQGSRVEDTAYHGLPKSVAALVHAPRRLLVFGGGGAAAAARGPDTAISVATAASLAVPSPLAPPLTVVVVPRTKENRKSEEDAEEKELVASLVKHAARSLSSASSVNPGMPVFVALDRLGFEAASRAVPYSVLFAPDFAPPGGTSHLSSSSSSPSSLEVASAVAAVAATLARSGGAGNGNGGGGGNRGLLLISSPAVATVGAIDETLLRLQGGFDQGDEKGEAPALLVLSSSSSSSLSLTSKQRRQSRKRGEVSPPFPTPRPSSSAPAAAAAVHLPEMLWAPASGKISNALAAWSRALAEEAAKEKAATTTASAKENSLLLLAMAASSARVAVARLPSCVFARSTTWERSKRKKSGGFSTISVQLVSFEGECRSRRSRRRRHRNKKRANGGDDDDTNENELGSASSLFAAGCDRERLLEAGLWKGGRVGSEGEHKGVA